jgi:hypothetical protein
MTIAIRFFAPHGVGVNEELKLDEVKINGVLSMIPFTHKPFLSGFLKLKST